MRRAVPQVAGSNRTLVPGTAKKWTETYGQPYLDNHIVPARVVSFCLRHGHRPLIQRPNARCTAALVGPLWFVCCQTPLALGSLPAGLRR